MGDNQNQFKYRVYRTTAGWKETIILYDDMGICMVYLYRPLPISN